MIRIPYLGETKIFSKKKQNKSIESYSIISTAKGKNKKQKKNRRATWYIRKMIVLEAEKSEFYNSSRQRLVLYDIWLNV